MSSPSLLPSARASAEPPFRRSSSSSTRRWMSLAAAAAGLATTAPSGNQTNGVAGVTACSPHPVNPYFPEEALQYDHYNGVTIHLDKLDDRLGSSERAADDVDIPVNGANGEQAAADRGDIVEETVNGSGHGTEDAKLDFATALRLSLEQWALEGRRGVWIHCTKDQSDKIRDATDQGFDFHMVVKDQGTLVLSRWLDDSTPSRLPHGPTHQVGVGCLVLHPDDPSRMLVVQEKSGPAAALQLWKMPTGLADPGEDIPLAAVRELKEETGLDAAFSGILTFRQAHATQKGAVTRMNSDLFFVCCLDLAKMESKKNDAEDDDDERSYSDLFDACPDEIADIRWMSVEDYCAQERWQTSPVYKEMNAAILRASRHTLFEAHTLPLGFARGDNTLYKSGTLD